MQHNLYADSYPHLLVQSRADRTRRVVPPVAMSATAPGTTCCSHHGTKKTIACTRQASCNQLVTLDGPVVSAHVVLTFSTGISSTQKAVQATTGLVKYARLTVSPGSGADRRCGGAHQHDENAGQGHGPGTAWEAPHYCLQYCTLNSPKRSVVHRALPVSVSAALVGTTVNQVILPLACQYRQTEAIESPML